MSGVALLINYRTKSSADIEAFLTHLAVDQKVAASTQNPSATERSRSEALSALLFLYREVLKKDLNNPIDAMRAQKPKRLPTVLTKAVP